MTSIPVTLLGPEPSPSDARGLSSALPADLLEQVRGRIGLLALLMLIAFSFDLVLYAFSLLASLTGVPLPDDFAADGSFQALNMVAASASAGMWWVARSRRVSASRLHTLGLAYEVAICFIISTVTFWQYFVSYHLLPNLTWVPVVVVLFPLIMPGPPVRMLVAAIAAGAMSPLALVLLELTGRVATNLDAYIQTSVHSTFAVGFAYAGARIVYGLGREVTAAREMGSYRLVERLGQGGMGEVWRAKHRMLARTAAIKLIRPSLAGPAQSAMSEEARQRFEREAQAIARLRSPHTVELFDFGVAANGAFYYVMELLDGMDADLLVRRTGPVPADRAIHLLRQVCHSLSEAESLGLVHRDIKPSNIFVCHYGEDYDFVKVLDFGIAKSVGAHAVTDVHVTVEGNVHGTPAFMAPEQALGSASLDGRADIYATGCLAYWLLTGHLVFTADTPIALLLHHTSTPPVPPSGRSELPIPRALDDIVLSCLAKDPAARPQTAKELSRRLAAVEGADGWTEERAREWWTRHEPQPTTRAGVTERPSGAGR